MLKKPTLIVIAGPTAVGKTSIAISLANELDTEIISADSRQCYRGMRIGTAQPTPEERAMAVHHFVDCYEPEQAVSAADFEHYALERLQDIFKRKETAIVCGGTGLYIKALCEGLDEMPAVDALINEQVIREYDARGIEWLRNTLKKEDPIFFTKGEIDNPARMLRALAFIRSEGKSIDEFRSGMKKERPFRIIKIGLDLPRDLLYTRINVRTDKMMGEGLLAEAELLFHKKNLKSLNTVGYTECFDYLEHKISLTEATDKIKQHSRNYAKRQLTWFRKDKDFHWFSPSDPDILHKMIHLLQETT